MKEENVIVKKLPFIKKRLYLAIILLFLSIIQLGTMGFLYVLMYNRDTFSIAIGDYLYIPFLCVVLFNLYFIKMLFLIFRLKPFRNAEWTKMIAIWIGSMSIFGFFLDWAAISDIRKEHLTGLYDCSVEFMFLYILGLLHIIFYLTFSVILAKAIIYIKKNHKNDDIYLYNENNYVRFNKIGLLIGVLGILGVFFVEYFNDLISNWQWMMIPYFILLVSPYALYLIHWVLNISKENRKGFLDEKQSHDFLKAGLLTLVLCIPVLFLFFLFNLFSVNNLHNLLWFPFYLFSTITIFSGAALFYYKKR